jgi:hypothetical protein
MCDALETSSDEQSTSTDLPNTTRSLFWVTRYSLGRTWSKELLVEHELGDNQTRHRLIEIRTKRSDELKRRVFLPVLALLFNPPLGEAFVRVARVERERRSCSRSTCVYSGLDVKTTIGTSVGRDDVRPSPRPICIDVLRSQSVVRRQAAARCRVSLCSLSGVISIGLTVCLITVALLYFFVRDLRTVKSLSRQFVLVDETLSTRRPSGGVLSVSSHTFDSFE